VTKENTLTNTIHAHKYHYALILIFLIMLVSSTCLALTKDELASYRTAMRNMIEETYFGLEPGTLSKSPLSEREKQERGADLVGRIMQSTRSSLQVYGPFYKTMTERMTTEIKTDDPSLTEWHRKLILGYKDSYEITAEALTAESISDAGLRQKAYADKKILMRIQKNAEYHHALRNELQKLIIPLIPGQKEQRDFIDQIGVNQYIEQTWK